MKRASSVRLFYFTEFDINLRQIADLFRGTVDCSFAANYLFVCYHAEKSWRWTKLTERDLDRLEPAQRTKIAEFQPASAFAIEHHVCEWPEVLPFLKLALGRYGGWVGYDDGTFEKVYTVENIERLEHPFGDGFKRASRRPASHPGDRIELDPSIPQPEDVFDFVTYKELLQQARRLREEKNRLHQIIYPLFKGQPLRQDLSDLPESKQFDVVWKQFHLVTQEYSDRLPIHLIAQCPYCGVHILQPVDCYSLMGFDESLKVTKVYGDGRPSWPNPLPAQRCKHALCATLAVNLNGLMPDDVAGWALERKMGGIMGIDSSPYVMVWPLIARYTSAVMHALPVGRLDDEEPIHRYTAYFTTYFVGEGSNLCRQMWVPAEFGGPATAGVHTDRDLLKWVRAGRLFWLDPSDTSRLVKGPAAAFPYANIEPRERYHILEDGQLERTDASRYDWQGEPPLHDESYPKTIE